MKKIEVSDELYNYILRLKGEDDKDIEDILERVIEIKDLAPDQTYKIVFIGNAGVGKSTIREYFFNYEDPDSLIKESLEPTRGIEYHIYDLLNLKCSVVDTSGQEMERLLKTDKVNVFQDADFLIYIVEASNYEDRIQKNYEILRQIIEIKRSLCPKSVLTMFIHKMDLLDPLATIKLQQFALREHEVFNVAENSEIPLYYTSIMSPYNKWLNIAFTQLFKIESLLSTNYKQYLDAQKS